MPLYNIDFLLKKNPIASLTLTADTIEEAQEQAAKQIEVEVKLNV